MSCLSTSRVLLAKALFNALTSLSIIFNPGLIFNGPLVSVLSKVTCLSPSPTPDPGSAFLLASVIMASGFASLSAARSSHQDPAKAIAVLTAAFASMSLLGCTFSPKRFGSPVLLFAFLQDVVWFFLLAKAGGYTVVEALGLQNAIDKMKQKKAELRPPARDDGAQDDKQ